MPKFKKFIDLAPPDYGAALKVSGFYVGNESIDAPTMEPFPYNSQLPLFSGGSGIDSSITVASGEFFIENPLVKWSLVNPADNSIFPDKDLYSLSAFNGFEINLRTETGELVNTFTTGGAKAAEVQLTYNDLSTWFASYSGQSDGDKRRFQVEVISTDYYGRKDTGIYFLNNKSPDITSCKVAVGGGVSLNLEAAKTSGLLYADIYASTFESFRIDPTSGYIEPDFYYHYELGSFDQQSLDFSFSPSLDSAYYYSAVLTDTFGTGKAYYFPSSVKPYAIDPLQHNIETSGFEGRVLAIKDTFNKNVNTQVVAKFAKDLSDVGTYYEVKVVESGSFFDKSDFIQVDVPQVKGINRFIHGTGSGRLDKRFFDINTTLQDYAYSGTAAVPIFSTYQTTGVQWLDHTLILDSYENLQPGFLTGQPPIHEVVIGAGNTLSSRAFWGGEFNVGLEEYVFHPSGGLISGDVYSGTYMGERTGGVTYVTQGVEGPGAGTGGIIASGLTGALVATNYSGLIIPEYEPHFVYPVYDYADYEFSVRTVSPQGPSPFGGVLKFTSGDIIGGITGNGYPTGLFDGDTNSGVAVYNAAADNLNISQYVTLDDAGIPVQIEKAGTVNEKETLLLLKAKTSNRPAIQFSETALDDGGMSIEYYGVGSDNSLQFNPQSEANPPVAKFFDGGDVYFAGDTLISGSLTVETVAAKTAETGYLVIDGNNKVFTQVGSAGAQGHQGTQGITGSQGTQGITGSQGTQGITGSQGTQGITGSQGTQGITGSQGTQGTQGITGSQGTQGITGSQGTQGITGSQGTQGITGSQGTQGITGSQGTQGITGSQGTQGITGSQGTQGITGSQGTQGTQGITGSQGTQGITGSQGTQGITGSQGTQGITGSQGTQGITGSQGTQGTTGDSFWTRSGTDIYPTTITDDVGIGIATPDRRLHVWAATAGSVTASSDSQLVVENSAVAGIQLLGGAGSHGIIFFGDSVDAEDGKFGYDQNDQAFYWKTAGDNTKRMFIASDGNVGIGTTTPTTLLNVVSSIDTSSNWWGDGYSTIHVKNTHASGDSVLKLEGVSNTSRIVFGRNTASDKLIFSSRESENAAGEFVAIDNNANLGVGTSTITGKLQVHNDGSGIKVLNEDVTGQLFEVYGDNGSLLTISDDLSDSLLRVNDAAGLPVFEVFANDTVIAGQYNQNDLVVTGNKVGISTAAPSGTLHVHGDMYLKDATTNASATEFLVLGANNVIEKRTGGSQGTQGITGAQGIQGITGSQGIQGITGSQGTQGITGSQGTQGITGSQGTQGITGSQGTQGITGSQGTQGITGSQGTQGITGSQGTQGITGSQGTQGITGSQGTQGITGSQGTQGITGSQGTQGITGSQGTQGITGSQGTQGITGSQGTQGITGDSFWSRTLTDIHPTTLTDNVGIGTATPGARLEIETDSNVVKGLVVDANSSVYAETAVTIGSERTSSNAYTLLDCVIDTDGTPISALKVQGDGNVGIGTDAPVAQLNLFKTGADDAISSSLYFQRAAGHYGCAILQVGSGSAGTEKLMFTAGHNNNPVAIGNAKITIQQDGNVGIGTTAPLQKLTIVGRANSDQAASYYGAWFDGNSASGGYNFFAVGAWYSTSCYFQRKTGQNYTHIYEYNATHNIVLQAGSAANGEVAGAGNVGIGTVAPTGKLQVHKDGSGIKVLNQDVTGQLFEVYGDNGSLLTISDDLSDSLLRVNDAAGLPVFEVFANDTVIAGQYNQNDLVVTGNKVGISTAAPSGTLHVHGDMYLKDATTNVSATEFLVLGANNVIEKRTGGSQGTQGITGAQGIQGITGSQGTQGITGSQGTQGITGSQGTQGIMGSQGTQGITGSQGTQGITGSQGTQGITGDSFWTQSAGNIYPTTITDNVGVGTAAVTGKFQVHNDGSGIKVLNADSDPDVFEVYGSNGTLFTVSDDLSDSLMSVNNAAGLPVFEAFADNTVVAGQYGQNDLVVTGNRVGIGTAAPSQSLHVANNLRVEGIYYDSSNDAGTSTQVLSSTGSGTNWVAATSGPQGTTGAQGTQGITGSQGTQGITGSQGTQGITGSQGTQGITGSQGTQGITGSQGTQGITGSQGTQGITGSQGTQGITGSQGTQGITGSQGTQGITGSQGTQGITGSQGTQGITGSQGTQGITGSQGTQGITGSQGTQGITGSQGTQGITGSQGTQGTQGITGSQGTQGITGSQGTQGITGDSFWTRDSGNGEIYPTTIGDQLGIGTADPDANLHIYEGTTDTPLQITRAANTGNAMIKFETGTTDDWIVGLRNDSTSDFRIYSYGAAADVFNIKRADGKVGIGETLPLHLLHLRLDHNAKTSLLIDNRNGSTAASSNIFLGSNATTEQLRLATFGSSYTSSGALKAYGSLIEHRQAGGLSIVTTSVSGDIRFYTNGSADADQRMVITSGGCVGIGTTSPSYTLEVNGSFGATTKSFIIDHPTKPDKKLQYGSLEGPEHSVYLRGRSQYKIIDLPEYWPELVHEDSITVQLTPAGYHQHLYVERIRDNKVMINTRDKLERRVDYFYNIYAERKDVAKLEVEINK